MRIRKLTWLILLGTVSFSLAGTAWADSVATVAGCAGNVYHDYEGEFKAGDFDLVNAAVDENGYLVLNTGYAAIDPNNIIIPFTREVLVTFLYEGGGYKLSDFGWMLAEKGIDGPKNEVYQNVNDNNEDGVLDLSTDDQSAAYGDTNGDGTIDARDNKQVLGTFAGGTELVFYLNVDDEKRTFYTKDEWNPDTYTSSSGECSKDEAGNNFTKTYQLGRPQKVEDVCTSDSNWMAETAY